MDMDDILKSVYRISEAAENIKRLTLEYKKSNDDKEKNLIEVMIKQHQYTIDFLYFNINNRAF